jgi:two-component system, NarL family, sensor histidine kinase FusK
MASSPHSQIRQFVQIAMFLPVVWLAMRHGWGGAAVGGAAASCAVVLLMPAMHDYDTFRAEFIVSFAISTMLIMGGRIAALDRSASRERLEVREALTLAQRNAYVGEMQLRMTSHALDQIRDAVQNGFALMMGRLRHLQPAIDDGGYRRQALLAQDQLSRLADGLYPAALRERGLPYALRDGVNARMLREAGITYFCEMRGPLSRLSMMLRMTVYRIVWEAITDACLKKDVVGIRIRIRCRDVGLLRGVMVAVYFQTNFEEAGRIRWSDVLSNLVRASSGLGLRAIRDRAAIYDGRVRERAFPKKRYVSVYMSESVESGDD